jgi:UDP-N-acetylmuramate: L-alanyl-gamma-D-glutamyl-meso-diaminopimelate ligase
MKIYFMGIGGTAMGNVALLMKEKGHQIFGADAKLYPPMSDLLADSGIEFFEGYEPKRLQNLNPDLIVVGNVISRGNPEVEWLLCQNEIPYCSMSELLSQEFLNNSHNIVVCGTHGKTTTTSIAAYLLNQIQPAGYLIGGVPNDFNQGSSLGPQTAGSPIAIEGDEYDTAFFDKRSKFIHYNPKVLIINNLEFDHADIFRDLEDIKRSFSHLLKIIPSDGVLLVNGDDQNVESLLPITWAQTYRVGESKHNDLVISNYTSNKDGSQFDLTWKGKLWGAVQWKLSGMHNARNAAMALLAVSLYYNKDGPTQFDISLINDFSGVKRRQEVIYEDSDCLVIEDFAHHPTAIQETLQALRSRYEGYRIVASFEPRSNTACRKVHQNTLENCFDAADVVCFGAVHRAENYAQSDRLDTETIAQSLTNKGTPAQSFSQNSELLDFLQKDRNAATGKTLYVFLSNGSFDGIMQAFIELTIPV